MYTLLDIDGIGNKTKELFEKINIFTVEDLLTYYPRRYYVLKRSDMNAVLNKEQVIIDGVVEGVPIVGQSSSKLKYINFRIISSGNIYNIRVFNQNYLLKEIRVGIKVIVIGIYDKYRNMIVAKEVRKGELSSNIEIEPIYRTVDGLNRKTIGKVIKKVLDSDINVCCYIPNYLISRYKFPGKLFCISQIHFPVDSISFKRARQMLKYEEFFLYLLKIGYMKRNLSGGGQAISRDYDKQKLEKLISELKFSLTIDQEKTINEISKDMVSNKRMNRLVQGDVGSGKTIVAFLAGYINYLSGYQTALMVPTEILARQHYLEACALFKNTDIEIVLLTSNVSLKDKKKIIKKIEDGEVHFVIGTQSLIQEGVNYFNLGLIITDEQHRFGVNQREKLKNKGVYPDVLSMSATPIPRTYALTIYGDMDVSNILTKPMGRKEIITYNKSDKEITDILKMMKKELDNGYQVYVIAPSIDEDESNEINNVSILKKKMNLAFGKLFKIGVVHGKMDNDVKESVMNDFEVGKINILISTTVIEVGVNVPNASMIVVFNANLFGLSTLHQLRGRVGRGNIQSYCILVSKDKCERLEILEKTNDGFAISEYDFRCRGEGDLFGVRQSGVAEFKLADINKDFDLLVRVKKDVDEFYERYYDKEENSYVVSYLDNCNKLN